MSNVTPIIPPEVDVWDDTPDGVQDLVLIPPGDYPVIYLNHHFGRAFGAHKANANCEITQGEFAGTKLTCPYNVRCDNSRHYSPPLSPNSYYRIDMKAITGNPRANLDSLRKFELIATVITVRRDSKGCSKRLEDQYSRILRLRKA